MVMGFVEVFSTPPVMHISPHAGLRKMFFDKFLPIMRNISYYIQFIST
jgi:hypothetical protein